MIIDLPPGLHADALQLWEISGLTRPWNDPATDLQRALDGPSSTLLAYVDGALRGTVMVGHDGHRGWMYYLAVDPASRGEGIGKALVTAAEAWVLARGLPKLMLMVRADNSAALGFYAALGYDVNDVATLGRVLT